ncbi:glucose 1-dehydrogenase [Levilactobacillus brevis]|uniref:glucose 1-dehydrogenase n=1 Tax=Levilactobacillus brevis TaxID=1580 RepID=UPI00057F7412|nr:glucose 1-dehydrogenase [Levilactobacillus brevis]KID43987.1 oxidoreductase, short-chain dehydrogenase/reductase family [Levilactobacillus brevis]MCU0198971.1 glucose 1-dehydrogenase [Levilactobacillus brevis]ODP94462.1 3-ketoacyl-ACP reductase [Levilactobacillus brevis]QCZ42778.1 Short-chain alcohol dehydrogenase [Levilactobacillus brevis]
MAQQLVDKVAIITGAGSGMGRSMAELFAKEGAKIVAADINQDRLNEVVTAITTAGGQAIASVTNVTKEADVVAMVQSAVDHFGRLDILVNNAGIMDNMAPVGTLTNELWDKVMTVNTTSVMLATREVLKIFTKQKSGVILNIASVGGLGGGRAGAAYTASKHAVVGLTKNTAYMYENMGIRTNAIAPGGIKTNIAESMTGVDQEGMARQNVGMPLSPEPGTSAEIAQTALFLCSDAASYVNGTVVPVDGGWTSY